jgi:hypothetical protein
LTSISSTLPSELPIRTLAGIAVPSLLPSRTSDAW